MTRNGLILVLLWSIMVFWPAHVAAQGGAPQGAAAGAPNSEAPALEIPPHAADSGSPLMRTLGALGVVICLIVGGYFLARRFAPQYFSKPAGERILFLVETLPMGEKRAVSIIEVENRRYLLGNTPEQITLLAELPATNPLLSDRKVTENTALLAPRAGNRQFRNLLEYEKGAGRPGAKIIPPDIRTKMRQLREALEH